MPVTTPTTADFFVTAGDYYTKLITHKKSKHRSD